eukprot:14668457-Alexandrium_andersonii.AAC.1
MANPPNSSATASADRRTAISVYAETSGEAEVHGDGGNAHALRGTFHDARQFGASPELSVMVFCVVDQCLMVCTPRMQTPPHVDRRVREHPAKS